jgi:hypothetical protein
VRFRTSPRCFSAAPVARSHPSRVHLDFRNELKKERAGFERTLRFESIAGAIIVREMTYEIRKRTTVVREAEGKIWEVESCVRAGRRQAWEPL